ncbi:MAG TPA: FAD/NAD(P)-binding oxidoreductase [Chitinophagaceae bacterium]|nr:FAD/NAD(P)-binding oxidoreductase [Chitinophagaceae bacterium]
MAHFQVLIIGGGNAGISTAAQLLRRKKELQIAIIEPSEKHYYQPAWTLVGAGVFDIKETIRNEESVIPPNVKWIREAAAVFQPQENTVITAEGNSYTYDYLVVAPGIQLNWSDVKGLKETIGKNAVTSNYSYKYAPYTYECLKNIKPGDTVLFTAPSTPTKCGGAPQKVMYMTADYLRRKGILKDVTLEFISGGSMLFGIKKYAASLQKMVDKYGIKLHFKYDLIAIDGEKREATFKLTNDANSATIMRRFDMIHVTPPQSAPDFIRQSLLVDEKGWVDVNKYTLQHTKYQNIFSLGDVTNTPNAKTGAAVRKQVPVLVKNLISLIEHHSMTERYSGYGSCPLTVGYGKLVLAEFGYDNKVMETFPFDQAKPRRSMWLLKKYVLPWLYWHKILKGSA